MGYRSEVAYIVSFENAQQPEVAHKNYLMFQAWVKGHSVPITEDQSFASGIKQIETGEFHTYEEMFKDQTEQYFFRWYPEQSMIAFYNHWTKWYESFPEVQWHMFLLDKVTEFGGAARFIRIGEDYEDVEVKEYGDASVSMYGQLDVVRHISLSLPHESSTNEEAA